ncbi:septation protein SepH [Microbacterium sp. ZXX196]|uniref:septation protein SepH n=1 Tax=Microbacterium sp. ZXX196 TaxID=2609291 RepID=UPI0012B927F2|nr:septation protein SepH [Microbacterium sp. ZXX196]MTE24088.1 DUF3071 domain-containing protein [Microbacterium sp. ZXX196]
MEHLTIVGTEGQRLVLATEHGQRFTLDIDDMLRSEIRRAQTATDPKPRDAGPSPREIQAHIRRGLAAEDVAELLGCPVERVRLFEGPVLAEREHIVGRALAMPVLTGIQLDQDENPTFGTAIRQKLSELAATGERWTSWKEDDGWVVKLVFASAGVEHDARWSYEPRRSALAPANDDAAQLSRQGRMPEGLIPRLRALDVVEGKDASSFDAEAFQEEQAAPEPNEQPAADTADLLEALRRRRGQREAPPAPQDDEVRDARPVAILGQPATPTPPSSADETESDEPKEDAPEPESGPGHDGTRRRGRPAMPSWDEIVFGARTDD